MNSLPCTTMNAEPAPQQRARPRVSVIVPVSNGGKDLDDCLAAIAASSEPPLECIVVDDAASDDTARRAAQRHGARLIRLDRRRGPAYARNRGARAAEGDILFFVDADVILHRDALAIGVDALQSDPDLSAVFGSYDDEPGHGSFLSQYRNLFHHWVHQSGREEASTFWAGCGAIRREVFEEMNGFDRHYRCPSIEDIELGGRMGSAGHAIRLEKTMLGKHMKQWKFWHMIKTDIFDRGTPWMRLVLRDRRAPNDLNLSNRSRAASLIAVLLGASFVILPLSGHVAAVVPTAVLLAAAAGSVWLVRPGNSAKSLYPLALAVLAVLAVVAGYLLAPDAWAMVPLTLTLALVWTHRGFYRFAAARRGVVFAVAAVPMQVLFFLGCAVSALIGLLGYLFEGARAGEAGKGRAAR